MGAKYNAPTSPCRHCRSVRLVRARGLCSTCYGIPQVRRRYPSTSKYAANAPHGVGEPTMEELEATIAEQLKRLPPWWPKAERVQDSRTSP